MIFIDFNPIRLVNKLRKLGVVLTLAPDGNLLVDCPAGTVAPELLAEIRKYKLEIIRRLRHENRGVVCERCGTTTYTVETIHDGQSARLDCVFCGRFLRFGVWYGKRIDP